MSEAELVGVLCAWDRVEAHAAARKLAVSAELARRNPAPEDAEFTADQVAYALGESRGRADALVDLAQTLETRLPGTKAALDDGTVSRYKAEIIARATALLDDAEARAAEQKILDRAARLTPGGLRAAIAAAAMEVAPKKAKERREAAAKDARVERWAEDSGNAALMGCELPPDEVLAADQRITAWARELRKAGLEGDMDQLRARAFLDLLLGKDSRPRRDASGGEDSTGPGPGGPGSGGPGPAGPDTPPPAAGPAGGAAGFAGRVTLTVPLATVTGLADRPGEIPGIGPIDPNPEANTLDRYQTGHQPTRYPAHQRTGPLPRRVGSWCASSLADAADRSQPAATRTRRPNRAAFFPVTMTNRLWRL